MVLSLVAMDIHILAAVSEQEGAENYVIEDST